jgi:dTMP kinase
MIQRMIDREVLSNFVALEGIDGAGTTTQLNKIAAECKKNGLCCFETCEPTVLDSGRIIRKVLSGELSVSPGTLARMFVADRYEHLYGGKGIISHLAGGELVVTDRYLFSSLAYQSVECGYDEVYELNSEFPLPEILIFLDIPVDVGDKRASTRESREIFENRSFQTQVRQTYAKAIETHMNKGMDVITIDGTMSEEAVFEKVWSRLQRLPIKKM